MPTAIVYTADELKLLAEKDKTDDEWAGVGRYLSYAVDIPNGTTTYSVFHGTDRISKNHDVEAGVNVLTNGNLVATVKCAGKNITSNLEGLDLAATP